MLLQLINTHGKRRGLFAALIIGFAVVGSFAITKTAQAARRLVSEEEARQLGLQRAWTGQVRVNAARNEVERAVLDGDRLTTMTSAGVLEEFNALTGETLWIAPIGNSNYPSLGPAASSQYVAVINGSTLYVLDRKDGKPIIVREVGGAPGASPAIAEKYVFVPLVVGRIEAYGLGEQKLTPWYYQSIGRAMVTPLATPESFVWTTDTGHMYVGRSKELGVRFRLETGSDIVAPPAYGPPYVYAATTKGEVFSINEMTGERQWKYATGYPVMRAPAVVGNRIYVTSEEPALHCIDAKKGLAVWEAPGIKQFAAAGEKRVYGVDDLGALVVLDAATGALLGRMPTGPDTYALVNDQTDRVYLVSKEGVVQCFHEVGANEPLYHHPKAEPKVEEVPPKEGQPAKATTPSRPKTSEEKSETPKAKPAEKPKPAAEPGGKEPAGEEEDPFKGLDQ